MQVLNKEEIEGATGAWFVPTVQGVATCIGLYVGLSNVPSATERYNQFGQHVGEKVFTFFHPDSEVLGQMEFN